MIVYHRRVGLVSGAFVIGAGLLAAAAVTALPRTGFA
jgi:hypothetical protein